LLPLPSGVDGPRASVNRTHCKTLAQPLVGCRVGVAENLGIALRRNAPPTRRTSLPAPWNGPTTKPVNRTFQLTFGQRVWLNQYCSAHRMSADSVVVFYGAQVPLADSEIAAAEARTHPLIRAARDAKLDFHWADFIPHDDHGPELLVGRRFGSFGPEDSYEAHVERGTVALTMDAVDAFLSGVGLVTPGKLIVRYRQDL
jgi:hypothetical protein